MAKDRILTLLGFAQKSGNVFSGENTVELYIKKNKIKLIIISEDASKNSKEKFISISNSRNIPYIVFANKDELSNAIGKYNRTIFGIKDSKFAKKVLGLYENKT
ncbi:MAG: ribosomal L7Ae/L30e/S12e/Gadd45 family protein [Maledivibacter sp.]|jgi:ribosomal protein L7Ae-like RNA K-turn-binding protein|nr:ribosomal L7Ae/L30e/S12e/Gadd45 family protein [Maledivibacter sp.]